MTSMKIFDLWFLVFLYFLEGCESVEVLSYGKTPDGFSSAPRGWNSFGLQSLTNAMDLTQDNVKAQCDRLANFAHLGYQYCSIDSGWSEAYNGDDYGRYVPDTTKFPNITLLAEQLHAENLKLGIYINPGVFQGDLNKFVFGTNNQIKLGDLVAPNDQGDNPEFNLRVNLNWNLEGSQAYCDSNVALWASWGVDLIKLDYITPGSPGNGDPLPTNSSGSVACYHRAIQKGGWPIRLDISWALDWKDESVYDIWKSNADSMRLDQDVNNDNANTLVAWTSVQRTIEKYREYILAQVNAGLENTLTIYPDLDNLYIGNDQSVTGLTDMQRKSMAYHWVGAGANLLIGSDLTKLDSLGSTLLNDSFLIGIADMAAKFPMRPLVGNSNLSKGSQYQFWVAGPDPNGVAVILAANYGNKGNNDLYDPAPISKVGPQWVTINSIAGLTASQYHVAYVLNDRPVVVLNGGQAVNVTLQDSEAVMCILSPTSTASSAKVTTTKCTEQKVKLARNQPTTVLTQTTYPIQSPGCGFEPITGAIPKGLVAQDGVISIKEFLYRLRGVICTDSCIAPNGTTPQGIPPSTVAVQNTTAACEIAVGISPQLEAYAYRTTLPDGVQQQECWDSTAYIIDKCLNNLSPGATNKGWWNGDHVYQFYQLGFRRLNLNTTFHVLANDNITSELNSATFTGTFSTNPFMANSTGFSASASGAAVTTLPTAVVSSTTGTGLVATSTSATGPVTTTRSSGGEKLVTVVLSSQLLAYLMTVVYLGLGLMAYRHIP